MLRGLVDRLRVGGDRPDAEAVDRERSGVDDGVRHERAATEDLEQRPRGNGTDPEPGIVAASKRATLRPRSPRRPR